MTETDTDVAVIPSGALIVLVGPSGSGKSTWAAERFRPDQVVSSDVLRALVGTGEHDVRAGTDAFAVLELVVARRMKRGLTTVIDSLGLDATQRAKWIELARSRSRPVHAIAFDTAPRECRARNKARDRPVPSKALSSQLARWPDERTALTDEFDAVHPAGGIRLVPPQLYAHHQLAHHLVTAPEDDAMTDDPATDVLETADAATDGPAPLRFGLTISSFTWPGDVTDMATTLARVAGEAEEAGFDSVWVMDHVIQIPQVGREWEPMLESTTTLGFLAAATSRIRLGTLVTGISYRNVAHVGKIAATLDVLSGGRAVCGLGAAWFDREHTAYGWDMPPLAERYELLEDALELFPLLWGPGAPAFSGRRIEVAEAICYPRPIQDRIPILVGGSGERRTLELVARHADACNLFGEPDVVERKVEVLREHCRRAGRDPAEVTVTQLSTVACARDGDELTRLLDRHSGDHETPELVAERLTAGTIDDHVGRFQALARAGVDEVIVSLHDIGEPGTIERFAPVIDRMR